MKNAINVLIEVTIREIISEMMSSGPSHGGAQSLRGGPYGYGNTAQLAVGLDPATKNIQDQEQAEINTNVEDQIFVNNKWNQGINLDPGNEPEVQLAEGGMPPSLPGYPSPGAIEYPIQHVPEENKMPNNLRAGVHDGTEEYMLDDIIDELEENERRLTEDTNANPSSGPNLYNKRSALPPFDVPAEEEEQEPGLGHMGMKPALRSSVGSYSSVMFPKNFVPEDQPIQDSDIEDEDADGLSDQIDLDQPDYITRMRIEHD